MAKLFIGGFPKDTKEPGLVELFSIHGLVNTVTIITDRQSGESKGYGFVTMNDDAGAQRAITALDGIKIADRTISVRFAQEKTESPSAPAGLYNKQPFKKPIEHPEGIRTRRPRRS